MDLPPLNPMVKEGRQSNFNNQRRNGWSTDRAVNGVNHLAWRGLRCGFSPNRYTWRG